MQSKPAKLKFTDLAFQEGATGREDCQVGWHEFYASLKLHGSTLDVGAGLGRSKERIPCVTTQDPAPVGADITLDISRIDSGSFDCVTCFDTLEHVVEDVDFLSHLCRIARRWVFLTTPNELVSHAANGCHCREYRPPEFLALVCKTGLEIEKLLSGNSQGTLITPERPDTFVSNPYAHQAVLLKRTNINRWAPWYRGCNKPSSLGFSPTYQLAADWLKDCREVEDWGCGTGYMRQFVAGRYIGIDSTESSFVDIVADLAEPRNSRPDGVLLKHVLEHDWRWKDILINAIRAFQKRMCLVVFTPFGERTKEIATTPELGVPDISFAMADLLPLLANIDHRWYDLASPTAYGIERIFYLEKQ